MYQLKLYITGKGSKSDRAIDNLRIIMQDEFKDQYSLKIIDLLENPEMAVEDMIFATPTLVKTLPAPIRKIIGDLSNKEMVLMGLEIVRGEEPAVGD